ncbi:MAG: hypothetical protein ACLFOY_00345 [Desulfatibacillaceae bacterium]
MEKSESKFRSARTAAKNTAFAAAVFLLLLLAAETTVRIAEGDPFDFRTVSERYGEFLQGVNPAVYHPRLGYVPKPDFSFVSQEVRYTHGEHGIRVHPDHAEPGAPVILAVGDSFAYGDRVGDPYSWPAILEKKTGADVINAGVFGYALDQAVLRAEELVPVYRPDVLVVSLIPDDVYRCSMAARNVWKPYFDVVDGEVVLKNVPVPTTPPIAEKPLWIRVLSRGRLADRLLNRVAPVWWHDRNQIITGNRNLSPVIAHLMVRIAELCREHRVRPLVVIQAERPFPNERDDAARPVLEACRAMGLPLANLLPDVYMAVEDAGGPDRWFTRGHMSPTGNALVADRIAEALEWENAIPRL